jgi:cytochrome c biogenesis protein CcmG/thiol:disulfide interchange protein DsbE
MFIPPVIFVAIAGLFAYSMFSGNPDDLPTALAGREAPALDIEPLGDKRVLTNQMLRDGELKLVNYWASWCAPCRVEHPNLTLLAAEGLPVYGINYKDQDANALAFLQELGDPYTALGTDSNGANSLEWGVYGVPETFLVDGDGTVLMRVAGPVTQRAIESRLRPAIEAARAD